MFVLMKTQEKKMEEVIAAMKKAAPPPQTLGDLRIKLPARSEKELLEFDKTLVDPQMRQKVVSCIDCSVTPPPNNRRFVPVHSHQTNDDSG